MRGGCPGEEAADTGDAREFALPILWVAAVTVLVLVLVLALPGEAAEGSSTSGTLIVLNKGEATASLISLATGKVVKTVETGRAPHEAAVSPDGKLVVVGNYGSRRPGFSLTFIELPSGRDLGEMSTRPYLRPHGIVFLDARTIAVTAEENRKLILVDVEKREVIRAADTDAAISHMVAVAPGLSRAFVANIGSGSVSVIDLATATLLKQIPTGAGAEGVAVSPDGKEVWISNRGANTLTLLDPRSLEIRKTIPCGEFPIRVLFTPDGSRVLVSCARTGDVKVFDARTRELVRSIPMVAKSIEDKSDRLFRDQFGESPVPIGILIPPDGKKAFIANTNADVITVIDLDALKIEGRLVAGKEPDGLGYSVITVEE